MKTGVYIYDISLIVYNKEKCFRQELQSKSNTYIIFWLMLMMLMYWEEAYML
jgi:hypothetical protein